MQVCHSRSQQTLARSVQVSGFGLFGGVDVTIEFCPAPPEHGVVFERIDLVNPIRIPALIDYVIDRPRCTVIAHDDASVAVIEHVMAALAGLRVDNCLVRINAPEPPICDGSSLQFVEAILSAGIVEQDAQRVTVIIDQTLAATESEAVGMTAGPSEHNDNEIGDYEIGFQLDYGQSAVGAQFRSVVISPVSFQNELACCRTFILDSEVQAIQAQGIGTRATADNILVFGEAGPIDNELRFADECVRHKLLDCVGDFALLGCDIVGHFTASQSGHRLNHQIIHNIKSQMESSQEVAPLSSYHCDQHQSSGRTRKAS